MGGDCWYASKRDHMWVHSRVVTSSPFGAFGCKSFSTTGFCLIFGMVASGDDRNVMHVYLGTLAKHILKFFCITSSFLLPSKILQFDSLPYKMCSS